MSAQLTRLAELYAKLDAFFARVHAAHGAEMQCGSGCSSCCTRFSITEPEAVVLRAALDGLAPEARAAVAARARATGPACPVLDADGLCLAYAARPAICRGHGLPMRLDDDHDGAPARGRRALPVVSSCEKNFTDPATLDVAAHDVLDQRAVSTIVGAIAAAFAAEEPGRTTARIEIAALCASLP